MNADDIRGAGALGTAPDRQFPIFSSRDPLNGSTASERPQPFESYRDLEIRREERNRISRELHDSTSQLLVALQLNLASLRKMLESAEYAPLLSELDNTLRDLHNEMRALESTDFWSGTQLAQLPLAIKSMAEQFGRRANLVVSVVLRGDYRTLPAELELSLYRIAQEALANVQRHAHASAVRLRLNSNKSRLTLIVEDDGVGFQGSQCLTQANQGSGLRNMRDRVRDLNGRLSLRRLKLGSRLSVTIQI